MKLRLFGLQIRLHPLLSVLTAVYLLSGRFSSLLCSVSALIFHECGHLLVLKILHLRVIGVEITPFGGLIEADGQDELPSGKAFLLASAGITVNLMIALLAAQMYALSYLSFSLAQGLLRANLALFFINLLPVLPLDGGKMLQAILRKFISESIINRCLTALGTLGGMLLITLSFSFAVNGELVLAPAFSGLYLIYMAAVARRRAISGYVSSLIGRRQKMASGGALPVQWLAVSEKTPARTLIGRLALGQYHMLTVVREDGRQTLGTLDEEAICEGLLGDSSRTLGELLTHQNGQS